MPIHDAILFQFLLSRYCLRWYLKQLWEFSHILMYGVSSSTWCSLALAFIHKQVPLSEFDGSTFLSKSVKIIFYYKSRSPTSWVIITLPSKKTLNKSHLYFSLYLSKLVWQRRMMHCQEFDRKNLPSHLV